MKQKIQEYEIRIRDLEFDATKLVQEHHKKEAVLNSKLLDLESQFNKPSNSASLEHLELVEELRLKLEAYETECSCLRESQQKSILELDLLK